MNNIKKFNSYDLNESSSDEKKKKEPRYPYEIVYNGKLQKCLESKAKIFLTNSEYDRIKGLAQSIHEKCNLLDEEKNTNIEILETAIKKVIKDTKE